MEKICSVCAKTTDSETAAILAIGGYGNARYICSECESDMDTATRSTDYDLIVKAMDRVGEKLNCANVDDEVALGTIREIFDKAAIRAEKIKDGSYDFALDAVEEDCFELTEEYAETEEDKELDRKEQEAKEREDKISNWVAIGIAVVALGFLTYNLITTFFLK